MILKKINLKDEFKMLDLDFCLEAFCPSNFKEISINRKRKTVLILPGGAYAFLYKQSLHILQLKDEEK